jgi:hypothetical protein
MNYKSDLQGCRVINNSRRKQIQCNWILFNFNQEEPKLKVMKNLLGIVILGFIVSSCSLFQRPSMTQQEIDQMLAENEALKSQVENNKDLEDRLAMARMQADDAMLKLAECEDESSKVHIIVGAFKNSGYADDYSALMKNQGYDGTIIAGPYSFNLVSSGSYASIRAALQDLSDIRSNVIETAWIYIE